MLSVKGGVGKSSVSAALAWKLRDEGYTVGILDADFSGSNMRTVLTDGTSREPYIEIVPEGFVPYDIHGIQVMSMGAFTEDAIAVLWNGYEEASAVMTMLRRTTWKNLDYLVIDCPPGSGTITQELLKYAGKRDSILLVTQETPSAIEDAKRSLDMVSTLKREITGIIVTMSALRCPHCNEWIKMADVGAAMSLGKVLFAIPSLPYDERTIRRLAEYVETDWMTDYTLTEVDE